MVGKINMFEFVFASVAFFLLGLIIGYVWAHYKLAGPITKPIKKKWKSNPNEPWSKDPNWWREDS